MKNFKFLYNLSIRTKLILTISLFSFFISGIFTYYSIYKETKITDNLINEFIKINIKSHEDFLVKNILDRDKWKLFKYLKNLSKSKLVKNIYIVDNTGKFLVSSNPRVDVNKSIQKNYIEYKVTSYDAVIGKILIEKNEDFKNELIIGYIKDGILMFFTIFLLSVFLSFVISERILKRLKLVMENIFYISKEKWEKVKKPNTYEKDEITLMLDAFYDMAKKLEKNIFQIKSMKDFYHNILSHIDNLILICDREGKIKYVNQHPFKKYLKDKNCFDIFKDDKILNKMKKIKKEKHLVLETKININNKDMWAIVNVSKINEDILLTISDITELKELQKKYLTAQKLSTVGEMSAGLAHELKNMLLPLNLYLSDLDTLDEEDKKIIERILFRMNRMIKAFLNFSKPPQDKKDKNVNLSNLLEEILFILSPHFEKKNIRLKKYIEDNLTLKIDPQAFELVVANLIMNAVQAMEDIKGRNTIEIELYREDGMCVFKVKDQGKGISDEIKEKIFTPFFTTKKEGTGLGLSTVYRIVYSNNGNIDFESSEKGTTFKVILPCGGQNEDNYS